MVEDQQARNVLIVLLTISSALTWRPKWRPQTDARYQGKGAARLG